MKTLLVLGIVQSIFLIGLIVSQQKKFKYSQMLLVIWLSTIACNLLFKWISFSGRIYYFDLMIVFWGLGTLHGPLVLLYTESVLYPDKKFTLAKLKHLSLFFLLLAVVFGNHYLTENTISINNGYIIFKYGAPLYLWILGYAIDVITLAYFGYALYEIRSKRTHRIQYYSDHDRVDMFWFSNFVIGVAIGYLLMIVLIPNMLGFKQLTDIENASIAASIYVAMVFYTGYVNYKQQAVSMLIPIKQHVSDGDSELIYTEVESSQYKRTGLSNEKAEQLKKQLLAYMAEERPYLDNKLTLRNISDHLGVSTNHLSQVINERFNKNFFTFVNEYRVNEFKEKIVGREYHHYTLFGVAVQCGFTSKSSFYHVFKKITGVTPSDYFKSLEVDSVA